MAIQLQHDQGDAQSRYKRFALAAGDVLELDFRGPGRRIDWPVEGVVLLVAADAGATVAVTWAFRPDYSKTSNDHFYDHGLHANIAAGTHAAWRETGELAALRFKAAGGAATVEARSLVDIDWSPIVIV